MIRVRHRGQQLKREELVEISKGYILTNHAREKIAERYKGSLPLDITKLIQQPLLAYFNTDGTVNIALNEYEYIVVDVSKFPYTVITFKEKSHNSITIYEKWEMARNGFDRRLDR